ncbi:MAG TPA: EAL domain-containing protein [Noviherbaspirillum sp.]|nr:EAL domain-containing protein [Noviherbaspirillum sp.]
MTAAPKNNVPSQTAHGIASFLSNPSLQLLLLLVLLLSGIWTSIHVQLRSTHDQITGAARRDGDNLSYAFAEQVKASLRGIDLSLISLREAWQRHPEHFREAVLRQQNYFTQEVSFQVAVIDADGMLVYSNLEPATKPMSLADREHFRVHRERASDQLFISKPVLGRVSKRWSLQFTRPILDPDNRFRGVMVMSVAPEYFSRFYDTIDLGENGMISLVKSSGEIMARSPDSEIGLGKSLRNRPFLVSGVAEKGSFQAAAQTDLIERVFTWRLLPDFGLVVVVGQSNEKILAPYYHQRRVLLIGGTLVSVLLTAFLFTLHVGLRQRARTITALTESEERNRLRVAALEAVGNAVVITNAKAEIEWVNQAFEKLTGYKRADALGRLPSELVKSGLHDSDYYEALWQTILSGKTWRGEIVNRRMDGSLYDEELVIAPVMAASGAITHFVGVKQDISERKSSQKALQQSHDLLAKLSAQVPGVIYQYRLYPDGRVSLSFVSEASRDIFGIEAELARKDPSLIFSRYHRDDADGVRDSILESGRTLQPWCHEFRIVLPQRGVRWVRCDARPEMLEDGSILWHGFIADITESKQAEQALRSSEERWKFALEGAGDAVWQWDFARNEIRFSRRLYEMLGASDDEIGRTFEDWLRFVHPEDLPRMQEDIKRYLEGGSTTFVTEHRVLCKDGSTKWVLARGMAISHDENGKPLSMIGTQSDTTERKLADEQLRIAAAAFESQEGMMVTDANGIILRVNRAFEELTGYSAAEVIGQTPAILKSGRQGEDFYQEMWGVIEQQGHWEGEIWNRRKNGELYPEWLVITAVKDANGRVTHYVSAFSDITARKEAEMQIRNLAFYDPLTTLPNRRLLIDRVTQLLAASARSGRYAALMMIDLDHFKTLNDTMGHDVGDQLLVQVAERLSASVRECDTVARLGGDEFVIMLQDLSIDEKAAATQIETVAAKILATLNQPYPLKGLDAGGYRNTPSIGITQFCGRKDGFDVLLKQADIALYQAKDAGRNTIRFYSNEMQSVLNQKALLEAGLRQALENNGFRLYYQPQVNESHVIVGAEALLRWQPPGKPMVGPAEFIPLAEETGLILPIGQWVLESACKQLADWERMSHASAIEISVNVSARQFRQPGFVAMVRNVLTTTGANPSRLKLELTETLILDDVNDTASKMQELRELGVTLALDDFGTGYSSLSYLKRLPLDQVKIDQSFVRHSAADPSDAAIVETIINMSHTLGLQVIAEGVETAEQLAFLQSHECKNFQGYLFGRPMPLDEIEQLLMSAIVSGEASHCVTPDASS